MCRRRGPDCYRSEVHFREASQRSWARCMKLSPTLASLASSVVVPNSSVITRHPVGFGIRCQRDIARLLPCKRAPNPCQPCVWNKLRDPKFDWVPEICNRATEPPLTVLSGPGLSTSLMKTAPESSCWFLRKTYQTSPCSIPSRGTCRRRPSSRFPEVDRRLPASGFRLPSAYPQKRGTLPPEKYHTEVPGARAASAKLWLASLVEFVTRQWMSLRKIGLWRFLMLSHLTPILLLQGLHLYSRRYRLKNWRGPLLTRACQEFWKQCRPSTSACGLWISKPILHR